MPGRAESMVDTDLPAVDVDAALVLDVDGVLFRFSVLMGTGICVAFRLFAEGFPFSFTVFCINLCVGLCSIVDKLDILVGGGGYAPRLFRCGRAYIDVCPVSSAICCCAVFRDWRICAL